MKQAKTKKNLKTPKKSKKNSFTSNSNLTATSFFILKNCSCKSNLKYLIQLDNKSDNSLESKNFIYSVQYINKNHKKKNYFFSRKIAEKMDHYDHSKKNSEILAFFNFIFTEFNSHAKQKPLLHFLFYTFSTST